MKVLSIIVAAACMFSCASPTMPQTPSEAPIKTIRARITYYNKYDGGDGVAISSQKRAQEGVTVAAHPDFEFSSEIKIPELANVIGDGKFVVQDRGPAITSKKASKGESYVFDVYVEMTPQKMRSFARRVPMYMDVEIF